MKLWVQFGAGGLLLDHAGPLFWSGEDSYPLRSYMGEDHAADPSLLRRSVDVEASL